MINAEKIKKFRCISCNEVVEIGKCGEHRISSGHKDFKPIYIEDKNGSN